jgi:hypothetical protein
LGEPPSPPIIKEHKPRPRERKGQGCSNKFSSNRPFISIGEGDDEPYFERKISSQHPSRLIGARIRSSDRWYSVFSFRGIYHLPYVNKLGFFTGHNLYEWRTTPQAIVASTTSTIAKRLEWHCRRHNRNYIVDRNLKRIVSVSYLYAATKNNYLWDRVLFLSKDLEKNGPLLHRIFLKFLFKANDSIRFVYSHVSLQTKWLLFRVERPRDKFANISSGQVTNLVKGTPPAIRSSHIHFVAQAMKHM